MSHPESDPHLQRPDDSEPATTEWIRDAVHGMYLRLYGPESVISELVGWDSFAEYLLDASGLLPKPPDPTGRYDDDFIRSLPASEAEGVVKTSLWRRGRGEEAEQYAADMARYRQLVKSIIESWRTSGRL